MVTQADILEILKTIPDPEMPISIVDLGIVHTTRVEKENEQDEIAWAVTIDLLPTFIGCPALAVLQTQIAESVSKLAGVKRVTVNFVYDPPWSIGRISPAGRTALAALGITVPRDGGAPPVVALSAPSARVACPYCRSTKTRLESEFGPTRCKMIYYCSACGSSFEHLKRLE